MKERSRVWTILIVLLVVGGLWGSWDLGARQLYSLQMEDEDARLQTEVERAEAQNRNLAALKREVQTDTWVERYVRTYWRWTKPNERIIVPRATPVPTPTPTPAPVVVQPPPRQFWEDWLDLLFGPPQ